MNITILKSGINTLYGEQAGFNLGHYISKVDGGYRLLFIFRASFCFKHTDRLFLKIIVDGVEETITSDCCGEFDYVLIRCEIKFNESFSCFFPDGEVFNEVISCNFDDVKTGSRFRSDSLSNLALQHNPFKKILLGGSPKSGTTWLERSLNSIPDIFSTGENFLFDWPENSRFKNFIKNENRLYFQSFFGGDTDESLHLEIFYLSYAQSVFNIYSSIFSGMVIDKTPTYSRSILAIPSVLQTFSYIHTIRNPLDVCVSRAFMEANLFKHSPDFQSDELQGDKFFFKELALERITVSDFFNHTGILLSYIDSWIEDNRILIDHPDKILFTVKYEDLIFDYEDTLYKLCKFIGSKATRDEIKIAKHFNEFKKLSNGRDAGVEDNSSFFRKGIVGDYKTVFTPEIVDMAVQHISERWKNNPYENFYSL